MESKEANLPVGLNRQLSHIEENIETDIQREHIQPKSKLKKFRKAGAALSHSKTILLFVVLLNCIDCILVLTELVLDVYFIGGMITTAEKTMETFNQLLQERYPNQFGNYDVQDTHAFYNKVLQSTLIFGNNETLSYLPWNSTNKRSTDETGGKQHLEIGVVTTGTESFGDLDDPAFLDETSNSTEEYVSHVFHKASIVILGSLVAFTAFKVFCEGIHFLKYKLEVFDAIVVIASFTLDLCYIRGLTNYRAESFVLILVIMIPWRIIRVLNSLVIAVKDNFHFMLKLMYKKNKLNSAKMEQLVKQNELKESCISSLVQICRSKGVNITEINAILDRDGEDPTANKNGAKMLGACFGFSREESNDVEAPLRTMEMTPLTRHKQ